MNEEKIISIIIPIYNEEKSIPVLYGKLKEVLSKVRYDYEIIFVNDGSSDKSQQELDRISKGDSQVKVLEFSRNFGKEMATTAGVNMCKGEACIMLDGDLQHPAEKIPEFLEKWEQGAEIVVGVREKNEGEGWVKKIGSFFFYKMINRISDMEIVSRATDYRLLDRIVIDEFNKLTERNRMTRALIDWLGFRREYIYFTANRRRYGTATYGFWKLTRLAFNSMVSFSLFPLRIAGYLGIFITVISGLLGIFMIISEYITKNLYFSGPAVLAVVNLFLIGIVLICLGLIALYIANIHAEVNNRPLYIIRKSTSNTK